MSQFRTTQLFLLITGCSILLTGCWSSLPIEDRYLEAGIAFDSVPPADRGASVEQVGYPQKQRIRRTVQYILPEAGAKSSSSQEKKFENEEVIGDSIMEMTRETFLTNRSPAGFHLKTIVISSRLLQDIPMHDLLDFYLADNDIRLSLQVYISTGTASDILEEHLAGEIPAFLLKELSNNRKRISRLVKPVTLANMIGPLTSESSFLLPNAIVENGVLKIKGAGVVKGKTQKYAGYLNESQVEGLQWMKGEISGGIYKVQEPELQQQFVYEIKSVKKKVKVRVKGDDISFHVEMNSKGRLSEVFSPKIKKMDNHTLERYSVIVEEEVTELVKKSMKKLKEMHVEVADLGKALRIQHPAVWERVKENWEEEFVTIPVTFSTKVHLDDFGASTMTAD
ncbi:Ger(x)C family spore germination protein [Paenibacillus sp. ACRSA]|uniref:Ger(x)C family spore germination protein n=1 Tax=Paenibacillus sp. ACRSA TaxID=2918211 RepID=UPI001EF4A168|nr:Ger(x)C family spore germination protein [Paenibacillus sp. ACRSA]MCG7379840.1 Ger(x)C family spore germination protein [Paenibacillus sp. ACRSA]